MIRIITLTIVICCFLISCGKKGDPVYEDSQKKAEIQNTSMKKIS